VVKLKKWLVLALSFSLGACVSGGSGPKSVTLTYKQGSTIYTKQADVDACKISSFKAIPQVVGTSINGGSYSPSSTSCYTSNGYTSCSQLGGYYSPPTANSYDINGDLRKRYIDKCMREKGYEQIKLPFCQANQVGGYDNRLPAPKLSAIACHIDNGMVIKY
jgi:hypothetical protein